MSVSPWPVGTDSGEEARKRLIAFINEWFAVSKYKNRLPRQHWKIIDEGRRENAGIIIRVISQPDPQAPFTYSSASGLVVEDWHQVGIFIKADQKSGGAKSVSAFLGALRTLLVPRQVVLGESWPDERTALENAGLHSISETVDGIVVDPDSDDSEGTFYKQAITLRLNTDCYLG